MKKITICLIGIDGSGKTSHTLALLKEIRDGGSDCKYVYLRAKGFKLFRVPILLLFKLAGLRINLRHYDSEFEEKNPNPYFAHRIIAFSWTIATLIDTIIIVAIRRYFFTPKIIISDRYVFDSIVDLMITLKNDELFRKNYIRTFFSLTLPSRVILLDLNEDEAFSRKREISKESLRHRRVLYCRIALSLNIPVVNSGRSFYIVQQDIRHYLKGIVFT